MRSVSRPVKNAGTSCIQDRSLGVAQYRRLCLLYKSLPHSRRRSAFHWWSGNATGASCRVIFARKEAKSKLGRRWSNREEKEIELTCSWKKIEVRKLPLNASKATIWMQAKWFRIQPVRLMMNKWDAIEILAKTSPSFVFV